MGRLEELSNRNEELQNQLDEAEDEMEQLTVKLKTLETENLKKTMQMKEHEVSFFKKHWMNRGCFYFRIFQRKRNSLHSERIC